MTHLSRHIIETSDGSKSLYIPELDERYHSMHGALQESTHVFINTGLDLLQKRSDIKILELGFGTGLNALLALEWANKFNVSTQFVSLEKYPLLEKEYNELEYGHLLSPPLQEEFLLMHQCDWESDTQIGPTFSFLKKQMDFKMFESEAIFDGIFFDAFAPEIQSDLWTLEVFQRFCKALVQGGFLVTYCAKGQVRRNMVEAGFKVERLPGPPGKREMLRATKL